MTPRDLSGYLRTTAEDIEHLLDGNYKINAEIAQGLSGFVGGSPSFWLTREAQYRASVERVEIAKSWASLFPVSEMVRMGWLTSASDHLSQIHACLAFFGVGTTDEWFQMYSNARDQAAFRNTSKFESSDGAVLAWLRKGELEAQKQSCRKWDRQELQNRLPALRALTRFSHPEQFIPQLQNILKECGVRVVILRPTKGCKAHGATFFSNGHPVVLLSFRYLSDDQFWFTVFHEIGHLILHSETKRFVEGDGSATGNEENEANEFASFSLIPREYVQALKTLGANGRAVMRFAKDIGIAPGIVVGQMQHQKLVTFSQLNNLKQRYKWAD
ncbi:ImmA/IrrE family metallo-endopeptidase [Lacisediminimonas profundi]|uniref:ImmA/IrrE family metallo-endopeptidase n=1 Tax=Lacisediminimonas profundi TaxID=2603856 RepID=UPI00138729D3|nr:ImmA/IrrE family metallo-endopeptidase [Lacisediminimonas profundi]